MVRAEESSKGTMHLPQKGTPSKVNTVQGAGGGCTHGGTTASSRQKTYDGSDATQEALQKNRDQFRNLLKDIFMASTIINPNKTLIVFLYRLLHTRRRERWVDQEENTSDPEPRFA
ncbi:hypothetical protein L6452_04346 [Arctium lappa]|uniref:Uncharacterized protein n=1 Tax=Arctium lappa TaxID=4217 RepID=A0ACB9FQC9_ARCLA|nr:hypothetical protein L6452_04346 [Arctium lappa]